MACLSFLAMATAIAASYTQFPLVVLFLLLFLLSLNIWLLPGGFAWRNVKPNRIPGPTGLPFLGSILLMGSHSHRKLARLAHSLNARRLVALSLGTKRVVISSHPATAKEILTGTAFSDRPVKESARELMFHRATGFAPSGEYWRRLRRVMATHMFSPRRVAGFEVLRKRHVAEILEGVWVEMGERGEVELRGRLQVGSLSSVVGSVFGKCFCGLERAELVVMVKEGYELLGKFDWRDYFPMGCLDFQGIGKRCQRLSEKVTGFVGHIIEERRLRGPYDGDDFLGVLLSLPEEDRLSDADMVAVLWEMIFRGTDTVAILLEWIMARMVLHPNVQQKAQHEIDTCVSDSRHVQDSDIARLPYLQAIVKEVLRMHPPGPLLSWARIAIHDVHVGKYFVPAGTTAMVNMWAIAHDGAIWKEPWFFMPERFMEQEVSVLGSDLRLAPFGSGRRSCPGKTLGLATCHLWLARLLQHYTWHPMDESSTRRRPVDLSERLGLSLEMKKPLVCRAIRRNSLSFW